MFIYIYILYILYIYIIYIYFFFVQQCQPIANNSILPTNQIFYTQNSLRGFDTVWENFKIN